MFEYMFERWLRSGYSFTEALNLWAQERCEASTQQVPMDGKGIKASLRDYRQSYQDFVSVVSACSVQQGFS